MTPDAQPEVAEATEEIAEQVAQTAQAEAVEAPVADEPGTDAPAEA